MKFCFFHLMPYTDIERRQYDWPVPNQQFDPVKAQGHYKTYIDMMIQAERCGFDWIGCNEHHFSPYGLMANPNVVAGALCYPTTTAKIAILGNLVPLNNPIRVAEEFAMLDCMSGGRLVAGLIRGIPHEYLSYNIPPNESWERQREALQLIIKAWTEPEPFGWEGKHYQFRQISIWPKPFQKPHPPLVISATTPDSAMFAAEMKATMGMVLLGDLGSARDIISIYKDTAKAHGWEPTRDNILIGMHMCIAETDAEARRHLAEGVEFFDEILLGAVRNAQGLVMNKTRYFGTDTNKEAWQQRFTQRKGLGVDELIERGLLLCGSPETVVKQIKRVAGELGHGVFNTTMKVGTLPDAVVLKGLELFRDRVLPHVRDV